MELRLIGKATASFIADYAGEAFKDVLYWD